MDVYGILQERFPQLKKERDFSFAKHTFIGCGGTAAVALSPSGIGEAAECLDFLEEQKIPHCFLGAGANVLACDGRFDGAVVRFDLIKQMYLGNGLLFAGAGVAGRELLAFAEKNCVTGFEPFAGIPTTVGGGVAMNAGISVRHFSDLVSSVIAVKGGRIRIYRKEECRFSVKESVFLQGIAILGVYFKAKTAPQAEIKAQTARYLERRAHLPKGRSMGCTFVNPESIPAGELIEKCGLKGKRSGSAYISEQHANFIINEGNSSADVARLIDKVKEEVLIKTGIRLREEIRRIP